MPTRAQIEAGHRPFRNAAIKTLIPTPQELAAREPEVRIHKTSGGVEFVRTPEARFRSLAGFPYPVSHAVVDGLRMAYVDEGPRDGEVVLLAHGQPTYSYLYRRMIEPLTRSGLRVIAPDLIGMGQSDKPIDPRYHHYETHVAIFSAFIDALELQNITLVCQDWGSVIGLRVVADRPERFARVLLSNGTLGGWAIHPFYIPEPVELDETAPPILQALAAVFSEPFPVRFQAWINYTLTATAFEPQQMIAAMCAAGGRALSPAEVEAYGAPFPSLLYKAAPRAFPSMVCGIGARNLKAWGSLARFEKPFLHVGATRDLEFGTPEIQAQFIEVVPGAKGQPHTTLDAGHFIQDNAGEKLAEILSRFIADNPKGSVR